MIDNQDLLVAVCLRVQDAQHILRLFAVSKTVRAAAESDPVWRSIILTMYGKEILDLADESLGKRQLRSQFPLAIMNRDQSEHPREDRAWTLQTAFKSITLAISHAFVECPEHAVGAFTRGLSTDEAGVRAASFILWCSPRRRGLPDMRASAIRFLTEPKPSPTRALSKAARKAFVPAAVDARGAPLLAALRAFLALVVMPGEASRLGRILWDVAGQYAAQNPGPGPAALVGVAVAADKAAGDAYLPGLPHDEVYMIVWSLLVLNTDAHSSKVRARACACARC